jgi:hypothetical protein
MDLLPALASLFTRQIGERILLDVAGLLRPNKV